MKEYTTQEFSIRRVVWGRHNLEVWRGQKSIEWSGCNAWERRETAPFVWYHCREGNGWSNCPAITLSTRIAWSHGFKQMPTAPTVSKGLGSDRQHVLREFNYIMDYKSEREGDKKFEKGKDNLTTGIFQWSKDYASGAHNFQAAGRPSWYSQALPAGQMLRKST